MDRRAFIAGSLVLLAVALAGETQPAGRAYRIGYLARFPLTPNTAHVFAAFFEGLRSHGYVEGQNLTVEIRYSNGQDARWPDLVRELRGVGVALFVTADSAAVQAVKDHASTVPLVMLGLSHPVEAGFVASLGRPGGMITGLSNQLGDLDAQTLQLLRDLVPNLSRLAVLWNPSNPASVLGLRSLEELARADRVTVLPVVGRTRGEVDDPLALMTRERAEALLVDAWYTASPERTRIVDFARKHRIASITNSTSLARDGLLMSYAPDLAEIFRRGAYFVDKILKGAKPADLPVEQPTKFELVINLKTARALGLTIPPSVLLRADEVIQ